MQDWRENIRSETAGKAQRAEDTAFGSYALVVPGGETVVPGGETVVPGGETVVPGGDTVVPGGETVVPGGETVVPGGDTVVPGGETVVPGGETVVPGGDTVVPGGETVVPIRRRRSSIRKVKLTRALKCNAKLRLSGLPEKHLKHVGRGSWQEKEQRRPCVVRLLLSGGHSAPKVTWNPTQAPQAQPGRPGRKARIRESQWNTSPSHRKMQLHPVISSNETTSFIHRRHPLRIVMTFSTSPCPCISYRKSDTYHVKYPSSHLPHDIPSHLLSAMTTHAIRRQPVSIPTSLSLYADPKRKCSSS